MGMFVTLALLLGKREEAAESTARISQESTAVVVVGPEQNTKQQNSQGSYTKARHRVD